MSQQRVTSALRHLLSQPDILLAPGVADALSGRLAARAGFETLYMTGSGTSAVRLGVPDVGLLTMSEMVDNAARIVEATQLPVISDADTGYGNAINVRRTVRQFERAGVAGIHIEDQLSPKRCGHFSGKQLIPVGEMIAKIQTALEAREDPEFLVIARCDAIAVEGFEAALERAQAYEEAGADMLFVEAPTSVDQIEAVGRMFNRRAVFNMAASGKTPRLDAAHLQKLGFKLVIFPTQSILAAIPAMVKLFSELRRHGDVARVAVEMASFSDYLEVLGLRDVQDLEERYGLPVVARVGQ